MRAVIILVVITAAVVAGAVYHRSSECARRANEVGASLVAAEREAESLIATNPHLLDDRDAPLARRDGAPIVQVLQTGIITVNGVHATDAKEVMDALAATDAHPPRVLLGIDAGAPLREIDDAARGAVAAGFTDAGVLFTRPTQLTRPAPSMITHEIRGITRARDPAWKAAALAQIAVRTMHGCKELEQTFADRGRNGDTNHAIVTKIPGALEACDCSIDLDNFHDLMWMIEAPVDHPPQSVVDVTLAPAEDHSATAITGATWADAAPALIAAHGQRVRFTARPSE
jgi:hypothetical protein